MLDAFGSCTPVLLGACTVLSRVSHVGDVQVELFSLSCAEKLQTVPNLSVVAAHILFGLFML